MFGMKSHKCEAAELRDRVRQLSKENSQLKSDKRSVERLEETHKAAIGRDYAIRAYDKATEDFFVDLGVALSHMKDAETACHKEKEMEGYKHVTLARSALERVKERWEKAQTRK